MFEDATFHSRGTLLSQTPKWMLLTSAVNSAAIAALIVIPLLYTNVLPTQLLHRILYAPQPVTISQPQPHTLAPASTQTQTFRNPFQAPPTTPTLISITPDPALPAFIGSVSNLGEPVVGADAASSTIFHTNPPPLVKPAPPRTYNVSRGVLEGLLLSHANPSYPPIARAGHISGTVILAATISATGHIENLQVISGPPALQQAAVEAVKTWRYRPYLLNNQPVAVETTINIVFTLGGS